MRIEQGLFLPAPGGDPVHRFVSSGIDSAHEAALRPMAQEMAETESHCPVATLRLHHGRFAIMRLPDSQRPVVQVFLIDDAAYSEFGYHAFRLLEAYDRSQRDVDLDDDTRDSLPPWIIEAPVDDSTAHYLETAISQWPIERLACLLDYVLTGSRVAAIIERDAGRFIAGLLSLLPPSRRRDLEIGGFAPQEGHPFRFNLISAGGNGWKAYCQANDISIVDIEDDSPVTSELQHPWSQLAMLTLRHEGCKAWIAKFESLPLSTSIAELDRLAWQMLASTSNGFPDSRAACREDSLWPRDLDSQLCFQQDVRTYCQPQAAGGALDLSHKEILHQLNRLDDAAFDAIAGSDHGLSRLEELWPQIKSQLANELIEESREQYVRLIVDRCDQRTADEKNDAAQSAIDVLRLLFSSDSF